MFALGGNSLVRPSSIDLGDGLPTGVVFNSTGSNTDFLVTGGVTIRPAAFLFADSPDKSSLAESARGMRLWALHPNRAYVTPEMVKAVHSAGVKLNVWTVNEPREIALFVEWGVDGIMSDFPERIPKG